MSVYRDYTADEQQQLLAGLQAAAVAVSAASPGRKEETASEGYAAASFILDSRADYVGNTLVSSVILEIEARVKAGHAFPDYVEVASAEGARDGAMQALRSVVALLDTRAAPEEAAGYKGWLMQLAETTARAGKEDQGLMGIGGVRVNDAERQALAEIAAVLGVERPPAS